MLQLTDLHAFYGQSHVLHGVSFQVRPGEIVALMGRNGVGRSTTAKAIMGLVQARGSLRWKEQEVLGSKTFEMARLGIGYVPESRDVFPALTVQQNLLLGQKNYRAEPASKLRWSFDDVYALFPSLLERRDTEAGVLSGGEQQMLSLGRSLMGAPELLIVDEPTEGLAPQVVAQVAQCLVQLRQRGLGVLLIEQKLDIALRTADRVLVMGHGRVVFEGRPQQLLDNAAVRREWLEV